MKNFSEIDLDSYTSSMNLFVDVGNLLKSLFSDTYSDFSVHDIENWLYWILLYGNKSFEANWEDFNHVEVLLHQDDFGYDSDPKSVNLVCVKNNDDEFEFTVSLLELDGFVDSLKLFLNDEIVPEWFNMS